MRKILALMAGVLATAALFTSCLEDDTDYVLSSNAYITSFSINDIKTEVAAKTDSGKDTTLVKTVYGDYYTFAIDHLAGEIYNVDSLPKGTDVRRVTANMSVDGGYVYFYQGEETKLYSSEDSIDFTAPVLFSVYAADGSGSRNYYIRLNVAQSEGDSLVWTEVEANNFPAGRMTAEKLVLHREYLMAFGEMDGAPIRMFGELDGDFKFSAWTPQMTGFTGAVDYSSIVSHEMALYMLAGGKLYSSLAGVDWTPESPEHTFTGMIGIVDGMLCLRKGDTIVACDPYEWSTENRVKQFTHDWQVVQTVDESLFPASPSVVAVPLSTNPAIVRTTLFGYAQRGAESGVSMWVKLSTDSVWTYYHPVAGNNRACPELERLTVVAYDGLLYAFGGVAKDGSMEAFEAIYTSADGGITWTKQTEKIGFPAELKGYSEPYACVADADGNIWLLCSDGHLYKGFIGG